MKKIFVALATLSTLKVTAAFATPITAENLIGNYRASGKVLFTKFAADLTVLQNSEFEVREIKNNGTYSETCNGTFTMSEAGLFSGTASCPSDRTDVVRFNMNLGNAQIEDLERGSNVMITTSKTGGMKIKATVKKY